MPRKLLIYAGAPLSSALDWSPAVMMDYFTEPVARLTGLSRGPLSRDPDLASSWDSSGRPVWRSLALKRRRLATGFSQQPALGLGVERFHADPGFFTTADVSFRSEASSSFSRHDGDGPYDEEGSMLSQFRERSLAAHHDIPSSQLDAISSQETSSDADATTSFISNSTGEESSDMIDDSQPPPPPPPPLHAGVGVAAQLHSLEDLPSAAHLASIAPQTMTVNLIVGIISILPERTVRTRWGARSLVEVLVGDETRAGFGITFWLPPSGGGKSPLEGLRAQDVVLMRNVALGCFMRKVYGQGLRRGLTKVHLLHRRRLDADDAGGHYSTVDLQSSSRLPNHHLHPQLLKARRVREWVLRFVGGGIVPVSGQKRGREDRRQRWDVPPPDSL